MQKTVLITLDGPSLEALIFDAVDKALRISQTSVSTSIDSPYADFKWLVSVCAGIPAGTLRQWDAAGKIPGSAKFGKRKLYHKQTVLTWLHSQISQKLPGTSEEEIPNQIDFRYKRRGGRKAS